MKTSTVFATTDRAGGTADRRGVTHKGTTRREKFMNPAVGTEVQQRRASRQKRAACLHGEFSFQAPPPFSFPFSQGLSERLPSSADTPHHSAADPLCLAAKVSDDSELAWLSWYSRACQKIFSCFDALEPPNPTPKTVRLHSCNVYGWVACELREGSTVCFEAVSGGPHPLLKARDARTFATPDPRSPTMAFAGFSCPSPFSLPVQLSQRPLQTKPHSCT